MSTGVAINQSREPATNRRWFALGFIALAQLMIAPDATVVSVALPTVQRALGGSDAERQWIITAYMVTSAYLTGILPSEIGVGFGVSCAMITAFSVATWNVPPRQAGVASSVLVTAQQIGGSLGTALLNAIAAGATAAWSAAHGGEDLRASLVHGYAVATGWGCVLLLTAAVIAFVLVDLGKPAATAPHS